MKNKILLFLTLIICNIAKPIIIENKVNHDFYMMISGGYHMIGSTPIQTLKIVTNASFSINKYISQLFLENVDKSIVLLNLLPISIDVYEKKEDIGVKMPLASAYIQANEYYLSPETRYFIVPNEDFSGIKINNEEEEKEEIAKLEEIKKLREQFNYESLSQKEKDILDNIITMRSMLDLSSLEAVD